MSFELNKIAGAILGTLLLVMGLGFLAEAIYAPIEDRGVGYALPEPEAGDHGETIVAVAATPLPVLLASASAENGAAAARKCASCHSFEEGAGNKTGPALYGIVGRPIAAHEGFAYSDALTAYGAEHGNWSYETLAAFIHDPRGDVPGTKMTFAGIRAEQELADILAYLQTLSGSPVPFPAVEATAEVPVAEDHSADAATEESPAVEAPVVETPAAEAAATVEEPAMSAEEPAAEVPAIDGGSELESAIASASLEDGASAMRACRACHDWTEDGRNKVGPWLYNVVGRPIGSAEGYNYSAAMTAYAAENGNWTYELLNQFISDPRGTVSGTKMTFAGVRDADDRAAVLALLRAQSPDPAPLAGAH